MTTGVSPQATDLTVATWPGTAPRLLRAAGVEELRRLRSRRRLSSRSTDPDELLDEVDRSGLLGRGGAAFPLAVKLRTVRDAGRRGSQTVVLANGEEGEPASVKDRWLLRNRPHLVLDGVRLGGAHRGCRRRRTSTSRTSSAPKHSEHALAAADTDLPVTVVTVDAGYVAGEETAAVRAINGGPAKPTDKPPRPFEQGVGGHPTLVSNVETLANLPFVLRHGAETYRSVGTSASPGTFLATITGGRPTTGALRASARRRLHRSACPARSFRRRRRRAC